MIQFQLIANLATRNLPLPTPDWPCNVTFMSFPRTREENPDKKFVRIDDENLEQSLSELKTWTKKSVRTDDENLGQSLSELMMKTWNKVCQN